jgi:hypothetical protein
MSNPIRFLFILRCLAIRALLTTAAWDVIGISCIHLVASEPLAESSRLQEPPVENSMFVDTVVRCRVTQRFEIYNPHSAEHLRAIKAMGFTQVILDWPNLHAAASELGLDIVMANWWSLLTDDKSIEEGIANAEQVDRRRLVAVSMMDEPERNSPETPFSFYQRLYQNLRTHLDRELPGVKLEISHWGPLRSWPPEQYQSFVKLYQATDRIRLMPYPDLNEGPLDEVYFQMMRSRYLMKLAGRELPQVVILQTWVIPENPKLPTIDELRVMAYQAILSGADTVSFFSYDPELWQKTAGFTEGFADLMHELTDFSRQFRTARVETRMDQHGVLTATLTLAGSNSVSVVVNTNRHPVQGLEPLQVVVPTVPRSLVIVSTTPQCELRRSPILRRLSVRHRRFGMHAVSE